MEEQGRKKAQETQIKRRPEQEKKNKKKKFHQFRCQVELNLLRAEQLGYLAAIDFREQKETGTQTTTRTRTMSQVPRIPNSIPHKLRPLPDLSTFRTGGTWRSQASSASASTSTSTYTSSSTLEAHPMSNSSSSSP